MNIARSTHLAPIPASVPQASPHLNYPCQKRPLTFLFTSLTKKGVPITTSIYNMLKSLSTLRVFKKKKNSPDTLMLKSPRKYSLYHVPRSAMTYLWCLTSNGPKFCSATSFFFKSCSLTFCTFLHSSQVPGTPSHPQLMVPSGTPYNIQLHQLSSCHVFHSWILLSFTPSALARWRLLFLANTNAFLLQGPGLSYTCPLLLHFQCPPLQWLFVTYEDPGSSLQGSTFLSTS